MDLVKLSERWIKQETGKFSNVTKMSFNCHFEATLSHHPVTGASPNYVTRWMWPWRGKSWHEYISNFKRRTGIVQKTQFHRRNFSPTFLPPEIPKTVFLREKRLDTGDIYGLEMHFSLENTGRLKYKYVWKFHRRNREWILFQGPWNSRQRSLCCIQWCWSHHYFRSFKNKSF